MWLPGTQSNPNRERLGHTGEPWGRRFARGSHSHFLGACAPPTTCQSLMPSASPKVSVAGLMLVITPFFHKNASVTWSPGMVESRITSPVLFIHSALPKTPPNVPKSCMPVAFDHRNGCPVWSPARIRRSCDLASVVHVISNGMRLPPRVPRSIILPFCQTNGSVVVVPGGIDNVIGKGDSVHLAEVVHVKTDAVGAVAECAEIAHHAVFP